MFALATVIVAPTEQAARARYREYLDHVSHEGAVVLMSGWTGVDLATYALDQPIRHIENDAGRSAMDNITRADSSRRGRAWSRLCRGRLPGWSLSGYC